MQFSMIALLGFAATAFAAPAAEAFDVCDDTLFSVAQCCATDVLGVADLNCITPNSIPTSPQAFRSICSATGQRARCCVLPVLGQALLCQTPLGLGPA